jgi:ferritin
MWNSSIGKECNSSQVYSQAKGWFKKSHEFSNDLEKFFFEVVKWRGRKWTHTKMF